MKKICYAIIITLCFFIFTACGTTKKASKTEKELQDQIKSEQEKQLKDNQNENKEELNKTGLNKNGLESENSASDADKGKIGETQVTEAIPEPVELVDKPNLELILPEDEDDDFDKFDEAERLRAEAEKAAKERKLKEDERIKKQKALQKELEKELQKMKAKLAKEQEELRKKEEERKRKLAEANKKKVSSGNKIDEPIKKTETNTKPKENLSENEANKNKNEEEQINEDENNKFLDEASAFEYTEVPERKEEFFSEFPNTEPEKTENEAYREDAAKNYRKVKLYKGQRLEVVYPGEGWVYLGETSAQKGIKYQQRIIQNDASIFNFSTEKTGTYILNFSYFDVFSDNFVTDALMVKVEEEKEGVNNTVRAPDYKGEVKINKKAKKTKNARKPKKTKKTSKIKQNRKENTETEEYVYDTPDILSVDEDDELTEMSDDSSNLSANEMLEKIRELVDAARAEEALKLIDSYFMQYSNNLDEAWFLRGQAYELNGKQKNVKKALQAYKTLTRAYPSSNRWSEADARIRYIKKFYINID